MVPPATSVLHDLQHALVAQMAQMGMVWGATGFVPHACAMHDTSALKSRALVYAAVIDLCERRVIEAYSTMEHVWPPGIMTFWPSHTPSLWKHGDDVLRSCLRWLIDVDGTEVVDKTLRAPLLRAFTCSRGQDPEDTRDALLAIGDWREMDVKQTTPSAIGIGKPDQVIDAEELDRIATDAERVRDAMPPLPRTAPDPSRDTEGFSRAFVKASEERYRKEHATTDSTTDSAEKGAVKPTARASPDDIDAAEYAAMKATMDVALAKIKGLRTASRIDSAVAAAVEAATSEHHARVREMKAELAQMREFETQVLKDNHRLRAENALLLGR